MPPDFPSTNTGLPCFFGKYLLLDRVAVGGMAEVFLAKSFGASGFEKLIAIKRILPSVSEEAEFVSMFVDEARVAGYLEHGGICPIFELGRIGASYYLAMEFVWGKDLLQVINRFRKLGRKPAAEMIAWIGSRVAFALDYAHRKKDEKGNALEIIHRDVSPQNVIISYEGDVKLIDFGIAKAASRTTRTQAGVLKGKSGYMSPEQVKGMALDPRSDVFALGTCLYELATCERLFKADSEVATLERVKHAQVPPLETKVPDLPKALTHIITKALAEQPFHRWETAEAFGVALQSFIHEFNPGHGRVWGQGELSDWMKRAFADEIQSEQRRFRDIQSAPHPPTASEPSALDAEPTLASDATRMVHTSELTQSSAHIYFRSSTADAPSKQAKLLAQEPTRMLSASSQSIFHASHKRQAERAVGAWEAWRGFVWGILSAGIVLSLGYLVHTLLRHR